MALVQGEGLQGPGQGFCIHLLTVDPHHNKSFGALGAPPKHGERLKPSEPLPITIHKVNLSQVRRK
jgi:hypothetical protein